MVPFFAPSPAVCCVNRRAGAFRGVGASRTVPLELEQAKNGTAELSFGFGADLGLPAFAADITQRKQPLQNTLHRHILVQGPRGPHPKAHLHLSVCELSQLSGNSRSSALHLNLKGWPSPTKIAIVARNRTVIGNEPLPSVLSASSKMARRLPQPCRLGRNDRHACVWFRQSRCLAM